MHVLFVYPNLYTQMGFNHGLASLSAVLEAAGHETRLVDPNENLPPVPTYEGRSTTGIIERAVDSRTGETAN